MTNNLTNQQHRQLNQELDSDNSMSDRSVDSHEAKLKDPNDPATIQAALALLNEEIAELLLDLDLKMLDFELSDLVGDVKMEDLPSPASPSSSDMEDELESTSRHRLANLLRYMDENCVLEPQPPNLKASQLYLLDHWADHNLHNFGAKLCIHPTTFQ